MTLERRPLPEPWAHAYEMDANGDVYTIARTVTRSSGSKCSIRARRRQWQTDPRDGSVGMKLCLAGRYSYVTRHCLMAAVWPDIGSVEMVPPSLLLPNIGTQAAAWLAAMMGVISGIPRLDGAACVGEHDLFDNHEGPAADDAIAICHQCPARVECERWFLSLRPSERPPGITAGHAHHWTVDKRRRRTAWRVG
jgi:Transcription factor WhiB